MKETRSRETSSSPRVSHLSWGRLKVEGEDGPFKDGKLFPGGAREWDWNETGTRHEPGVQPADVEELLEHGATVVVLGSGFHERLRVTPEALRMLDSKGVCVHVRETEEAVRLYNELRKGERAGALLHSTCCGAFGGWVGPGGRVHGASPPAMRRARAGAEKEQR